MRGLEMVVERFTAVAERFTAVAERLPQLRKVHRSCRKLTAVAETFTAVAERSYAVPPEERGNFIKT